VAACPRLSEGLEGAIQGPGVGSGGSIQKLAPEKTQIATGAGARLSCPSFGWITSWKPSASLAPHEGRASLAYLQEHPDDDSVHVVMG
jgi:hypothetical protein